MQMSISHSPRLAGIYVLCYYTIDDVTLFTLKIKSEDDKVDVNLWNYHLVKRYLVL